MDEDIAKYKMVNYLEVREIDLRRQIGETNKLVKLLEAQLREIIREKNRLKTEIEGAVYKDSGIIKDRR